MKKYTFLVSCYQIFILIYLIELPNAKGNITGKNIQEKKDAAGGCFCKLSGTVDDCECKVENVDYFNNLRIQPLLHKILKTDYFRYFKVNLNKKCPFWYDDHQCSLKDCAIDKCKMDELPIGLKENIKKDVKENKYSEKANTEEHTCEEKIKLAALDKTISDESKQAFQNWSEFDDAQMTFCEIDDELSSEMEYVDLLLNPERYTGYRGHSPHRIWNSIYNENCFNIDVSKKHKGCLHEAHKLPNPTYAYGSPQLKASDQLEGFCLEKRVFYRMISGLHTSINIHLSAKYLFPDTVYKPSRWGMNVKEFKKRFDPDTTVGQGPQWLKNLYFTYLVELRAIAKAVPYLEMETFYTGNETNDIKMKNDMKTFLDIIRSFNDHFDESKLFQGDSLQAKKLKAQFQIHFRNISRIMDCVGCDKCKLWGKLQVQGMGTALKILFSGNSIGPHSVVNANKKNNFQLRRTEIVSLINAFGRLSESIKELNTFRNTMK